MYQVNTKRAMDGHNERAGLMVQGFGKQLKRRTTAKYGNNIRTNHGPEGSGHEQYLAIVKCVCHRQINLKARLHMVFVLVTTVSL